MQNEVLLLPFQIYVTPDVRVTGMTSKTGYFDWWTHLMVNKKTRLGIDLKKSSEASKKTLSIGHSKLSIKLKALV